jgi:hypothetical protein
MNKYRFYLSETNYIEFEENQLNDFKDVEFTDDNIKGKLVHLKRYDGKTYLLIVPMDMLEIVRL